MGIEKPWTTAFPPLWEQNLDDIRPGSQFLFYHLLTFINATHMCCIYCQYSQYIHAHTHAYFLLLGSFMNLQIDLHSIINTYLFALNDIHLQLFHSCAKMQKYHTD